MISVTVPPGIAKVASVFCGCGDPVSAWAAVYKELKRLNVEDKQAPEASPESESGEWWVLAYLLDHLGLTEHGVNVEWAWLEADGLDALRFLDEWGSDWMERDGVDFFSADGTLLSYPL